MSIKALIENIKSKGLLQAMGLLDRLYQTAIESEEKLAATEAKCAALAAENAAQGNALKELRSIAFNARRNSHNCGPFQYSDLCEEIIDMTKLVKEATQ